MSNVLQYTIIDNYNSKIPSMSFNLCLEYDKVGLDKGVLKRIILWQKIGTS